MPAVGQYVNPNKLTHFSQTDIEIVVEKALSKLTGESCRCAIVSSKHVAKESRLDIKIAFGYGRGPVADLPAKQPLAQPK